MRALLGKSELPHALLAWEYLAGAAEPRQEAFSQGLVWLQARWAAGDEHLPLWLVRDLGYLLLRGSAFRFASAKDLGRWAPEERALRLSYEDRVLGRWALDPTVQAIHIELAGMPEAQRAPAVAHAVSLALAGPLAAVELLPAGNAAHLRGLSLAPPPEEVDALGASLDAGWRGWALAQFEACIHALSQGRLFRDEDIWEIAHHPQLPSESARLAMRELNGAAARIGKLSPSVALEIERRIKEVPVDIEASDAYPTGGFDAISTRGALENLVRTEVAYVGEGAAEEGGIDLFDVRFVESELLFYTRDESPLLDAQRELVFVIAHPAELRHKLPGTPNQGLILLEGLALALQADLVRVYGPTGSRLSLCLLAADAEDKAVAAEELALLRLALEAEIAHKRASLHLLSRWDETPAGRRFLFSSRAPSQKLDKAHWIRVGEPLWRFTNPTEQTFDLLHGYPALRSLLDLLLHFF